MSDAAEISAERAADLRPARAATGARRANAAALAAVILLAVLLRLIPVFFVQSLDWPDEVFQATEQAHRLVYGTGLLPWEFQIGVRSWLLPDVIAVIMEAARVVGDGPTYYLPAIAIVFSMLAATPVICCFLWCRRLFGLTGAITGAVVVATMPDLIYLGARTLSEVVAGHVMVLGMFALMPDDAEQPRRRVAAGGALLALAAVLRVHLLPALALVAAWSLVKSRGRGTVALFAGGIAVILLAAIFDWITLGSPLGSIWRYIVINTVDGVSASYGVFPWYFYIGWELVLWNVAIIVPFVLAEIGARRMPLLFLAALVIVLTHSVVPHKEYRFIYPAILLATISAGIGLAEAVSWAERALRRPAANCAAVALTCWCAMCVVVWVTPGFALLRGIAHDGLAGIAFVENDPGVCGLGVDLGPEGYSWTFAGYTYLHRPVPRYWPQSKADWANQAPAFNTLLTMKPLPEGLGYKVQQCFGDVCVAQRPGTCATVPMQKLEMPVPLR